ncbi:MAG: hypothetical protein SNJ57_19965, partial [Cyanobacteriota bacterium]
MRYSCAQQHPNNTATIRRTADVYQPKAADDSTLNPKLLALFLIHHRQHTLQRRRNALGVH